MNKHKDRDRVQERCADENDCSVFPLLRNHGLLRWRKNLGSESLSCKEVDFELALDQERARRIWPEHLGIGQTRLTGANGIMEWF